MLLTDRGRGGLESLAQRIRRDYGARVETLEADLVTDTGVSKVQAWIADHPDLSLLVNNAGFGTFALFHEADLGRQLDMVRLHVDAPMRLCRIALPAMVARGQGAIVNVASAGAFTRFPRDATYIGTKLFLVAFTECLAIELAGTGVVVQALCPGWLRTGFGVREDYAKVGYRSPIPRWLHSDARAVAESSLRHLGRGSITHVPSLRARVVVGLVGSRLGMGVLAHYRRIRDRKA